jgi:predicted PurR-regulated permease PerM
MFKYISEILSKFTQTQRVVALIIILFSIVVISIGPKIVELTTYNNEELETKIELQKKIITELNENVNDLNQKVIKNQIECTNRIIERENEILLIVNEIENYVKKPKKSTTYRVSEIYHGDTLYGGVMDAKMMGTEIQLEKDEKLIRMVQKLKTNCKKSN